jgi:hypothetical protein
MGRVMSFFSEAFNCRCHARSRANILRGIRIGSLMHGTPEAIPIWLDQLVFPRVYTTPDTSLPTPYWYSTARCTRSPLCLLTNSMWGLHTHVFQMQMWIELAVIETPQLQRVLLEVACQQTEDVASSSTLMEIEGAVRAAIKNGEIVLLRRWGNPYKH